MFKAIMGSLAAMCMLAGVVGAQVETPLEPAAPAAPDVAAPAAPSSPAAAAVGVISREDLGDCKLPHGEILLPLPSAPEASNGYIFRISDGKFGILPRMDPGKTNRDLMDRMRLEKTGDLFYSAAGKGTLIVISGKVGSLGRVYLFGVSDVALTPPKETTVDPTDARQIAGTVPDLQEGVVYIVQTVGQRYALLRVLRKQANGVLMQYVYQPDGTTTFIIPRGMIVALPADALLKPVQPLPPTNVEIAPRAPVTLGPTTKPNPLDDVLEPYLSTHLLQRRKLIEHRIAIVRAPAVTNAEVAAKADAIEELGELRANEAVDVLIDDISFQDPRGRLKAFSIEAYHPAVRALEEIGKPASLAALQAIRGLRPDPTPNQADPLLSVAYRLRLLTLVVKGVEGADVAEFLLRRDMATADPAAQPLYAEALKYLREP